MEYLLGLGFNNNIVDELKNNYDENSLILLSVNKNNVINVINYFKEIGITNNTIEEILLSNIDFLFIDKNEIENEFNKYEIKSLVSYINNDIEILYRLF